MAVMSGLLYDPSQDKLKINPLFYNGDLVRATVRRISFNPSTRQSTEERITEEGVVHLVWLPNKPKQRPKYQIEYGPSPGPGMIPLTLFSVLEAELELIKRGNLWNYFHAEPLEFKDAVEEADFYHSLGHYELVSGPTGGWTMASLMWALLRGKVDYFIRYGYPLGGKYEAYRLIGHPETSKRIRKELRSIYKGWRKKVAE